jgi:AraC-like DNA-binding protein
VLQSLLSQQRYAGEVYHYIPASESAAMVKSVLTALVAAAESGEDDLSANQLIMHAQQLMHAHLHDPQLNVSALAGMLDVSREHLTRLFSVQLGQTPYHYLQRKRLLEACRLLKDTSLPIQEISRRIGFSSQALLAQRFKHVFGMTATEFRKVGVVPLR